MPGFESFKKHVDVNRYPLWFQVSCIFLLIGFWGAGMFLQQVLNPDMLAYLSIAHHYQHLDFPVAFNSYWSPLLSWLLAFSPWLNSDPILSFRILHLILGWLMLFQCRFWALQLLSDNTNRLLLLLLLTCLILAYSLTSGYADFLSVYCLLLFLRALFQYTGRVFDALWLAATVLLSFFAKSFMLPLCLSSLLIFLIARWVVKKKRPEFVLAWTAAMVLVGLGLWGGCLYWHYGFFTLNSSYAFNTTVVDFDQYSVRSLPYPKALFNWEDPYYFQVKPIHFWTSGEYFLIHWNRWVKHWSMTGYLLKYFSYLGWILLFLPLAFWKIKPYSKRIYWLGFLGIITGLIWFGYSLVLLVERYLIPAHFLLVVLVFGLWDVWSNRMLNRTLRFAVAIVLFLSFTKTALFIAVDEGQKVPYLKNVYESSENLADKKLLSGKNVVIFQNDFPLYDFVAYSCYLSKGHFLGEIKRDTSMIRICKEYQVDFILDKDSKFPSGIPESWNCVYRDSTMKVSLYKVP